MALSAASGISLLVTSLIISGAAAADAFTMLCDLAANEPKGHSQAAGTRGGDETVPLHLHACRLIASCISSSSSRQQFEAICKSRVIPSISSDLCAAFKTSAPSAPCAAADDDAEASASGSRQLPPSVACMTALCRCSSLVPALVASFMPDLIQHLQVMPLTIFILALHRAAAAAAPAPSLFSLVARILNFIQPSAAINRCQCSMWPRSLPVDLRAAPLQSCWSAWKQPQATI